MSKRHGLVGKYLRANEKASLSEEDAKALALEIYCTVAFPKLSDIARRLGRTKEEVQRWYAEDCWLDERAGRREKEKYELLESPLSPSQTWREHLKRIRQQCEVLSRKMEDPGMYLDNDQFMKLVKIGKMLMEQQVEAESHFIRWSH